MESSASSVVFPLPSSLFPLPTPCALSLSLGLILARRLLAVEHAQRPLRQGEHLVLTGIHGDSATNGGDEPGDRIDQRLRASHPAGEQDAVHRLAVERWDERRDVLGDLVRHRFEHRRGIAVAARDPALDLPQIVGAEQIHQPAAPLVESLQLRLGERPREAELDELADRERSGPLRRERPLTVEAVVDVDVAATLTAGFPLAAGSSLAIRAPRLEACSPNAPDLRSAIIACPIR